MSACGCRISCTPHPTPHITPYHILSSFRICIYNTQSPRHHITLTIFLCQTDIEMPTNAARNLHGKTVLITGASSGIGRSCAFEFARTSPHSLKLILTARRVDRLHDVAAQIKEELGDGVRVHVCRLDVSKPAEIKDLFPKLPEEFRDVDILVNNAGFMSGYDRAPNIPSDVIESVWATNVTGVIHMTQEFLEIAKKKDEGGRGDVIMIGSIAGREAYAGGSVSGCLCLNRMVTE